MISSGQLTSGANLTSFALPASLMLPFSTSSLTLHASALEADGMGSVLGQPDPLRRMLAVLGNKMRATSSTLTASMMKPYNPIIGEVCIAHSSDAQSGEAQPQGDSSSLSPVSGQKPVRPSWRALVEQVSHHPPITAAAAEGQSHGGSFRLAVSTIAVPTFCGNYVEVSMKIFGSRMEFTLPNGDIEIYVITSLPSVYLRGVMGMGASFCEWAGELRVECEAIGLVGSIIYKPAGFFGRGERHLVSGSVKALHGNMKLSDISGDWTRKVVAKILPGGEEVELLPAPENGEARPAEMFKLPTELPYVVPAHSRQWERHPETVWRDLTAALLAKDWNTARAAKATVEQGRREERKAMTQASEQWETVFFRPDTQKQGDVSVPWLVREGAFDRAFDPNEKQPCKPL
eukprot:scaffold283058_cov33-Tisochrysis_lutea.AAC.1